MKPNPVVHFEIAGDDPDRLQEFYTSLFDWAIEPIPDMEYRFVKTADTDAGGMTTQMGAINGGMTKRTEDYEGRGWIVYVNVESVEATLERAGKLGAKVLKPRSPVPGMGWFAVLRDPHGNTFGLWQTDPEAG